jgi:protein-tyrosine-phosphatase
MNILFVCYANIARSFIAERILMGKLKAKNVRNVSVSSAGLFDMNGSEADPVAVNLLLKSGFDSSGHISRLLTEDLLTEADKVIVMEESHRQDILDRFPGNEHKIQLLKSFSPFLDSRSDLSIRDCHNKSAYHYRLCFAEIYEAIEGLVKCI